VKLAPDFPLIHLATHGILNDKDPDRSYLAFSAGPEGNEDTRLYVRDLYAMRLHSELVVLSACETGIGQLSRGEGLLSLARGFSYAGARSLLTTLWSIPDGAANSGLLPAYYTQLQNGADKAAALRQAQLGQIDNAFTENLAHPFYWAAFTPVGDMSPLEKDEINWFWGIFGAVLAIGAMIFLERRRRRSLA
jgi:CHAT domain-containing protein